jgi:hypothetical protein
MARSNVKPIDVPKLAKMEDWESCLKIRPARREFQLGPKLT